MWSKGGKPAEVMQQRPFHDEIRAHHDEIRLCRPEKICCLPPIDRTDDLDTDGSRSRMWIRPRHWGICERDHRQVPGDLPLLVPHEAER